MSMRHKADCGMDDNHYGPCGSSVGEHVPKHLRDSLDARLPAKDDDGSKSWCDDCHGYTHMPWCPAYREKKTTMENHVFEGYAPKTWNCAVCGLSAGNPVHVPTQPAPEGECRRCKCEYVRTDTTFTVNLDCECDCHKQEKWHVVGKSTVVVVNGRYIAAVTDKETAECIVTDHARVVLVPGLVAALREIVTGSGVEFNDARVNYVTLQVDRAAIRDANDILDAARKAGIE